MPVSSESSERLSLSPAKPPPTQQQFHSGLIFVGGRL